MPTPPAAFKDMKRQARRFEGPLQAAASKALERIRESVSINALAMALESKDPDRVLALLPDADVKNALSPLGPPIRDAFFAGGRVGAARIQAGLKRKAKR